MKLMKKKFLALLAMVVALGAANRADANLLVILRCMPQHLGRTINVDKGNSNAGIEGQFAAHVYRRAAGTCPHPAYAQFDLDANIDVQLLGYRRSGLLVDAGARVDATAARSAHFLMKVGPYTVVNRTGTLFSWTTSKNITLVSVSRTFTIGPIPITVTGAVGAGMAGSVSVGVADGIIVQGAASGNANGSASAYVNAGILRGGVSATLKFLQATLSLPVQVYFDRVSANVTLTREALRLIVKLFVDRRSLSCDAWYKPWTCRTGWSRIWSYKLVDVSASRVVDTLASFTSPNF